MTNKIEIICYPVLTDNKFIKEVKKLSNGYVYKNTYYRKIEEIPFEDCFTLGYLQSGAKFIFIKNKYFSSVEEMKVFLKNNKNKILLDEEAIDVKTLLSKIIDKKCRGNINNCKVPFLSDSDFEDSFDNTKLKIPKLYTDLGYTTNCNNKNYCFVEIRNNIRFY